MNTLNDVRNGCICFDTLNNRAVRVTNAGMDTHTVRFHDEIAYQVPDENLRAPTHEEIENYLATPVTA